MLTHIIDDKGKSRPYEVEEVVPHEGMARRWQLCRQDTGTRYEVSETLPGRWGCTCKGFFYRQQCKHVTHFQENDMTTTTKQPATIDAEIIDNKPLATTDAGTGQLTTKATQEIKPASPRYPPCGALAKSLSSAQQRCRSVEKDSRNKYHNYDYASAENVIEEAKTALADSGLAVVPIELNVNGTSKEGVDRFELERKFLLIHESGESLPIVMHWPICPEKGRPLDKATAIADTTSLAYFYRDLLLMPRVKTEDAEETNVSPTPPPQAVPPARDFKPGMINEEQFKYLVQQLRGKGNYPRELLAALGLKGFGEVSQAWWLFIRACVDYQVDPNWLKNDVLKNRTLNELDDDEIDAALKRIRIGKKE